MAGIEKGVTLRHIVSVLYGAFRGESVTRPVLFIVLAFSNVSFGSNVEVDFALYPNLRNTYFFLLPTLTLF